MAKDAKNKKNVPFAVLRKGALLATLGASVLAGGLLSGCDEGVISGPPNTNFYYGAENPNPTDQPGKVGDFYIETDDGDIWQLTKEGWEVISNIKGPQGANGITPSISDDGFWVVNNIKTNVKARGEDAVAPTVEINAEGFWVINGTVTDKKAVGQDAATPTVEINAEGFWVINGVPTTTKAKGEDAVAPTVEIEDGYWVINGTKSDVKAEAVNGKSAFELAVEHEDFKGNVAEWLASLKGADGEQGDQGYYVTSVREVVDDAWGISSHFEFTLNDQAGTKVNTQSVSRLMPNYYYGATTGAELLELIELGAENIQLENDIDLTSALTIGHNLSIDLNNHKLTYSDGTQVVIDNKIEVEFKDGEMEFEAASCTTSSLKVQGGASLILDRVEYVSAGTNVMVIENATSVKVVDSHLTGAVYCVGTNALTEQNFGVNIEIDDCEFDTTGYEDKGAMWYDTTPIFINIPCVATIKDSKITGNRQAVIVRGGNVVIENCKLINTGKDLTVKGLGTSYDNRAWGSGNAVTLATLVVGNDGTGIYANYATNLTLTDVEIKSQKASIPAIYAIGNDGENLGANLVINTDLEEKIPETVIANNNVHLTFAVDSANDLLNVAKEVHNGRNIKVMDMSNFRPSIVLTQDINETIVLSCDDFMAYGFMTQQFANFIANPTEFEYNVQFHVEISNSYEVAALMEGMNAAPTAPFIVLRNNIDLADIFEMMGETSLSVEESQMISMLNQYVVKSQEGYAVSDMYTIYCSLPIEVNDADEMIQLIMTAETQPTISLKNEVEFNGVLSAIYEMIMNQPEMVSEGEGGEMSGGIPQDMPIYYAMPTADIYLSIRDCCTEDTKDNLVWEEDNEIVSSNSYNGVLYAVSNNNIKEIVINNGVDFETAVVIEREVKITNNGYITMRNDTIGDGVFHVKAGGKLTLEGCGTIDAECESEYKMAIWADGGEVIINDGFFTNRYAQGSYHQYDLIYASNSGKITINGGRFECKTPVWTLNVKNGQKDTTFIYVKGGYFYNYNPSESYTDENQGNIPPTNYVVDGYMVEIMPMGEAEFEAMVIPAPIDIEPKE
ncbi:MAG: hypothetical protein ACLRFE_00510 [Clostridia bacterium]